MTLNIKMANILDIIDGEWLSKDDVSGEEDNYHKYTCEIHKSRQDAIHAIMEEMLVFVQPSSHAASRHVAFSHVAFTDCV